MEMKKITKNNKGQITSLYGAVLGFVMIGVLLGVSFLILSGFLDNLGAGQAADAVNSTIQATTTFVDYLPIIAIVIVAALLLGLVVKGLASRSGGM